MSENNGSATTTTETPEQTAAPKGRKKAEQKAEQTAAAPAPTVEQTPAQEKEQRAKVTAEAKRLLAESEEALVSAYKDHEDGLKSWDVDFGEMIDKWCRSAVATGIFDHPAAIKKLTLAILLRTGEDVSSALARFLQTYYAARSFGRDAFVTLPISSQKAFAALMKRTQETDAAGAATGNVCYELSALPAEEATQAFRWARGMDKKTNPVALSDSDETVFCTRKGQGHMLGSAVVTMLDSLKSKAGTAKKKATKGKTATTTANPPAGGNAPAAAPSAPAPTSDPFAKENALPVAVGAMIRGMTGRDDSSEVLSAAAQDATVKAESVLAMIRGFTMARRAADLMAIMQAASKAIRVLSLMERSKVDYDKATAAIEKTIKDEQDARVKADAAAESKKAS